MDKSAIAQIQESANIPAVIKQVEKAQIPVAVVPHSMNLSGLEEFMANAGRYRNTFSTTSIDDFVKYNQKFDEDGATCFIDAERMNAKTIFDMGTVEKPLHKEHVASIKLKQTAAFSSMLSYSGERLSQKMASDFIEDWNDEISVVGMSGDDMKPRVAADQLRNLTIAAARDVQSKVSDFSEEMSAMERIEAKASGDMPSIIKFKCAPYAGLDERVFEIRISILTGDDKPKLSFRILKLESIQEEIAEEFKGKLSDALKENKIDTFIGNC